MKEFGGKWTEKKLDTFIAYVIAYLRILNKYKNEYNWKTVYFDGFAGYGEKRKKIDNITLFNFSDNENINEEYKIYEGSPIKILKLAAPFIFDYYIFIDSNKKYIKNLREKIKNINNEIPNEHIKTYVGDCNLGLEKLSELLSHKKVKFKSLALLDPFGMQLNWESIEKLKVKSVDLWVLLPSGVAINRLLDNEKKLKDIETLTKFFGMTKEEIENIFYSTNEEQNLFGNNIQIEKINKPIDKIVEIYIKKLKEVFKYATEKPLILKNSKNVPIYHFIFASNNNTGLKIANDIIEKRQENG